MCQLSRSGSLATKVCGRNQPTSGVESSRRVRRNGFATQRCRVTCGMAECPAVGWTDMAISNSGRGNCSQRPRSDWAFQHAGIIAFFVLPAPSRISTANGRSNRATSPKPCDIVPLSPSDRTLRRLWRSRWSSAGHECAVVILSAAKLASRLRMTRVQRFPSRPARVQLRSSRSRDRPA
jgi:hypothetical protein